jgi:hypothetical protein
MGRKGEGLRDLLVSVNAKTHGRSGGGRNAFKSRLVARGVLHGREGDVTSTARRVDEVVTVCGSRGVSSGLRKERSARKKTCHSR